MRSKLQLHPKSKILKHGYINIYSQLNKKEERQIYFKTLYKKQNPDWDDSLVYLAKKLGEFLAPETKLLDIGCGNGNYLIDENRTKISWAVGIDVDKNAVEKNQCLDEIVFGDLEKMPFKDNSFDIVTSLWVLEHIKDPKKAFSEIHRVLKPRGKFLFATPNYNFLPLRIIKVLSPNSLNNFLNKVLYGRYEKEIFKTHYRANTTGVIKKLAESKFKLLELFLNYDPGYLSFNLPTFKLVNLVNEVLAKFNINIFKPHIIGVFEKV